MQVRNKIKIMNIILPLHILRHFSSEREKGFPLESHALECGTS